MRFDRFSELVGRAIKICGIFEYYINCFLEHSSKDPVITKQIIKLPLRFRIRLLRDLMLKQPQVNAGEVKVVCKELESIFQVRNVIAHNPVFRDDDGCGSKIKDIVHSGDDPSKAKEYTGLDLIVLHKRQLAILKRLVALMKAASPDVPCN